MKDLPPLAWAILCCVGIVLIVMNLGLVALFQNRKSMKISARPSRSGQSWQKMGDMMHVLRDPFAEERKQLDKLSGLIHELDKSQDDKGGS